MDGQVEAILDDQERRERRAYASPHAIEAMIRGDFADAPALLDLLERHRMPLLRLFAMRDVTALAAVHVPVRTCAFLHVAKHTRSQVAYVHGHDCHEIVAVMRGECRQRFPNTGMTLALHVGDVCLLRPGAVHAIDPIDGDEVIVKIMVAPDVAREAMRPVLDDDGPGGDGDEVAVFRSCSDTAMLCVRMLLVEHARRRGHWRQAARGWLSLLAVELRRAGDGAATAPFSPLARRLSEYVARHPADADLHGFATSIGYSDDYASRLVRQSTGRTFLECVADARMRIATRMLLDTDQTVASIARLLGYASRSGLYKRFRRTYGLTPDEYRRLFRGPGHR